MPDYSSLVPGIAQSVGVPTPLAMAMLSQESGIGQASPNIGQVLAGTAANPGYSMAPISPQDLKDPATNIRFSLQYLKNKAAAQGFMNLNDPAQAAGALQAYNGGGDPSYVQHVNARMFGQALPGGTGYVPPVMPNVDAQANPPPPMPDSFGAAPAATAPTAPARVDMTGHGGDSLIALGLGMLSNAGAMSGVGKAGAAYAEAQAQSLKAAEMNAQFVNDAQNRDATAPERAAQTAALRAQGWNALNAPNTVTADQALNAQVQQRGQNVQMFDAQQRAAYQQFLTKGAPQQFVVPGDDPSKDTIYEGTKNAAGQFTYTNTSTGNQAPTLPQGAIPQQLYNQQQVHQNKLQDASNKTEADVLTQGTAATAKLNDLDRVQSDLAKPGALAAPGAGASIGRAIDSALGTSLFGDLSAEQTANFDMKGLNWQNVRSATQGTGRLMANEINILSQNAPTIATSPVARQQFFDVLRNAAQRQKDVADAWTSLDPAAQLAIKRSGSMQPWLYQTNAGLYAKQAAALAARSAAVPAAPASVAASPPANRPPLSSFWGGGASGAPGSSGPAPTDPINNTAAIPG